ncbi:acyl carrier protein [Actinopolyspora sp. H202]|uniref:Act minimal PKS acyl carrier protein n=1 Tax=Actinopolyspora mzabensis TaxID=995066 RepID=A0A1G8ZBE3_ACTMZ|nr:acyl carrier protein [Actinopolyspora mzabensis]SDK12389.1 act minimal PKS acyl carrier protein [Actinopolyspora mzabensis]
MSTTEFTVEDLKRILREAAGSGDGVSLDGDILDIDFEVLGYDSLALLETGGRIEREYEISLDESAISEAETPRALVEAVNNDLGLAQADPVS